MDEQNRLHLRIKKLTSLFGIDRLHVKNACQVLDLSRNCFFDIALDVQSVPMPFQGFGQLQELYLYSNQLSHLPEHVFADLAQLQELDLGSNQLNNLPEHVFERLTQLRGLYLDSNQLSNLPEHIFADLAQLQKLSLGHNQLSEQEKQRIEEQLPNTEIYFD